ncbi:hypothetical protein GPECTOR_84g321 [Gonium pectorale]|uniref:ubiquitinyl hydrolase 1 n=1 Tax=Gonium pectorale TaxID=33097 RepID=A0A150G2B3_GONPE|nr:hypothetical protein GPECTOR_84g321 [Gonium pectorale]|eukprot:KXZ43645.1 hypothetical protein GPECTOR_84g321 [Gonium pectorale]
MDRCCPVFTYSNKVLAKITDTSGLKSQQDAGEFLMFLMEEVHKELMYLHYSIAVGGQQRMCASRPAVVLAEALVEAAEGEEAKMATVQIQLDAATVVTSEEASAPSLGDPVEEDAVETEKGAADYKSSALGDMFHVGLRREGSTPVWIPILNIEGDEVTDLQSALLQHAMADAGQLSADPDGLLPLLTQLPPCLVLQLGRFRYVGKGRIEKLRKPLPFPMMLELGRELLAGGGDNSAPVAAAEYELRSVIVHVGDLATDGGHFVAYRRQHQQEPADGRWLKFDDILVEEVDAEHVLQQEAYVLFYQRRLV